MTIGRKLTLTFLLIAISPVIIVGIVSFNTIKSKLQYDVFNKIDLVIEEKAEIIRTLLDTKLANLQYLAQDSSVVRLTKTMINAEGHSSSQDQQDAYKELKAHLVSFADFYGGPGLEGGTYADIMVADLNGYMWIGTYGPDEGGNEADAEWFIESKNGIYLGDIEYNPTMKQTTQIAAMPIKNEKGETIAILQVETNINRINNILNRRTMELGNTGKVYLVSRENIILTGSRFDPAAQRKEKVDTAGIKKALETYENTTMVYKNYKGTPVLGSIHIFSLHVTDKQVEELINNLEWVIIGEIDEKEAFSSITKLRNKLLVLILIIIVLVLILALYSAQSISKPIVILKNATVKIGRGNLNTKVTLDSKDELSQLATSFNKMTEDLKNITASRDELDKEIAKRKQSEDQLKTHTENIEKINKTFVGRELRMVELKKEIEELKKRQKS